MFGGQIDKDFLFLVVLVQFDDFCWFEVVFEWNQVDCLFLDYFVGSWVYLGEGVVLIQYDYFFVQLDQLGRVVFSQQDVFFLDFDFLI